MSKTHHILTGILACLITLTSAAYSQAVKPQIAFLSKKQAATAIVDDSLEPYFNQLQPMEMAAKTGSLINGATIEAQRTVCRKRYQAGVLGFTEAEQTAIRFYIDKISPVLIKDYPLIGNMPWSFLKVSDSIEGGLPHTRGKHIVLSETMCKQMAMSQQIPNSPIMAHMGMLQLLVHEQAHVFQRTHPGKCDSLYTGIWGFEKATVIDGCEWLTKHHLANPDAVLCPWILPAKIGKVTEYLWPLVVFSEGNRLKRMPSDFNMIAISVKKEKNKFALKMDGGKPVSHPLRESAPFRSLFPMSSNIYHPDEASADMFATIVILDSFLPAQTVPPQQKKEMEKHLAPLRQWFTKNFR